MGVFGEPRVGVILVEAVQKLLASALDKAAERNQRGECKIFGRQLSGGICVALDWRRDPVRSDEMLDQDRDGISADPCVRMSDHELVSGVLFVPCLEALAGLLCLLIESLEQPSDLRA